MTTYEPEPGTVLVKLAESEFGNIPVPTKAYDSLTWGLVVKLNSADTTKTYLENRIAYWRKYKDDARVPETKFALIEIKDILGSSYESDPNN